MKKQYLMKQVCGLSIMVAGALVPLSSAQAADELSDRYINGYLNDPYTNEVAADTKSVLARGAEGPIRTDASTADDRQMTQSQERFELLGTESYNPPVQSSGAQGPIRDDSAGVADKTMTSESKSWERFEPLGTELYNPPVQSLGAQGPMRDDPAGIADKTMTSESKSQQRFESLGGEPAHPIFQ